MTGRLGFLSNHSRMKSFRIAKIFGDFFFLPSSLIREKVHNEEGESFWLKDWRGEKQMVATQPDGWGR